MRAASFRSDFAPSEPPARDFILPMRRYACSAPLLSACRETTPPSASSTAPRPFGYIESQVDFGPRIPGTRPTSAMAAWLDSLLRARADTLIVQQLDPCHRQGRHTAARNFLARFNPGGGRSGCCSWRTGTAVRSRWPHLPRLHHARTGSQRWWLRRGAAARRGRRAQAGAADGRGGSAVRGRRGLRRLHQDAERRADRLPVLRALTRPPDPSRCTPCCSI